MNTNVKIFGKTFSVPVMVYSGGKLQPDVHEWDEVYFVERAEDLYGLTSHRIIDKRVLVVDIKKLSNGVAE